MYTNKQTELFRCNHTCCHWEQGSKRKGEEIEERLLHLGLLSGVNGGKAAQVTSAIRRTEDRIKTKFQYE
jgi:hypothetical protein